MHSKSILRALQILGVNAVPAAGYFGAGWSPGTTLLLYWLESLVIVALVAARIAIHRKATRKRGHTQTLRTSREGQGKRTPREGTLLGSFLTVAIPFNLAHGVFLLLILFLFLPQMAGAEEVGVDFGDLHVGLIGMVVLLCLGFLLDLFSIDQLPFHWIEQLTERSIGRVAVIHLSILFGMMAMAFWDTPRTFFMVFIVLKVMSDLSWLLPQGKLASQPPRWLSWMSRFGKDKDGESFAEFWRRTHAEEEQLRRENEETLPPGRY